MRGSRFVLLGCTSAAALTVLVACSSSGGGGGGGGGGDDGSDAPAASFATALTYVPPAATTVAYTDWKALGHPAKPYTVLAFAGSFTASSATIEDKVGVNIADADWEIDSIGTNPTAALHFSDEDLSAFADGLEKLGFQRASDDSGDTLTCASVNARCGLATWAFGNFHVDPDAGVLVEYDRSGDPLAPSNTFAERAKTVVAPAGSPSQAIVRLDDDACLVTGLRERNPAPPQSIIDQLDSVVGPYSIVRGLLVAADNALLTKESVYVELADHAKAATELKTRADAGARLHAFLGSPTVATTAAGATGAVDRYTLTGKGRTLYDATAKDGLAVNVCPTS